MSVFLRILALAAALVLASASLASATPLTPDRPESGRAEAVGPERQILVMLRMGPQHFRPNTGYGGGYGDGEGRSARWRVAQRLAQQHGVTVLNEWPMSLLGVDCYVMAVPADQSPEDVAARLGRDPSVSWAEPMHTYHGRGEPVSHNDPLYPVQPTAREWRLAELHQISTGRNVRVAVIDSMIEKTHPDLVGQVETIKNFVADHPDVPEAHGTGVAGVIAARADNGLGIAGVAPQAKLLGLRACWQESGKAGAAPTVCDSLSLARALDFAISHNTQIINMSLSGPTDVLLGRLLDLAIARDITVVAAYDRKLPGGGFPASHGGVVPVVDEETGPPIAGVFSAPGADIPTTEPGGRWFLVNGSSYSAAQVSGLFALLRQRAPSLHSGSALVLARTGDTINACATLLQKLEPCDCNCAAHAREALSVAKK
ncbi:MAG: S8 family serine peptidase [Caulobacteraceae bacterium]